jgi:hypothetical protein
VILAYLTAIVLVVPMACSYSAAPADTRAPLRPTAALSSLYVSPAGDDGNAGTDAKPFQTISRAAEAARPGTQVVIAPGTYDGAVVTQVSGRSDARIAFVAGPGGPVVVRTGVQDEPVWHNVGDYVDIVGFDISGDALAGVQNEGSFVRIMRNRVHDVPAGSCINSGAGENQYAGRDIDVIGNVVFRCGKSSLEHGIYMSNPGGFVANNISYGHSGYGIHCWHNCNRLTISNNLLFGNGEGGMVIGQGDGPNNGKVAADDFLVANNIVVSNSQVGITESGTTGPGNRYVNNLVHDNGDEDIALQTGRQIGTLVVDPGFVDFQVDGSGDYHLADGSPARDAGTPDGAMETSIDGAPRPQGGGFDLGPYER